MNRIYWRHKKAYRMCLLRRGGGVIQLEKLVAVSVEEAAPGGSDSADPTGPARSEASFSGLTAYGPRITLSLVESGAVQPGEAQEEARARGSKLPAACWVLSRGARGTLRFKPLSARKNA